MLFRSYIDNVVECELYKMQKGDILYSHINSLAHVGKVAYYDGKQELYHGMNLLLMRVNDMVDSNYLYAYMLTSQAKHIAQVIAKPAVNQASISINDIRKIKLPVPPMGEQRKIAEILGVWDEAIEKQSRLIERLEVRKRALMQRLLTGLVRLSGFTTPWQKVKLGEIAQIRKGKSLTSYEVKCGLYPVIAGGKESPYSHNEYTDENVITVSASGAYAGYISYHSHKIWASDCSVIKEIDTKSNILFMYNLLLYRQAYIYSLQIGGAQPHVFPKDIERIKLLCPSISEQKAIAEVLTTADDEIATHRKKLEALRLQKRGLMQQLLTGKTRVKI